MQWLISSATFFRPTYTTIRWALEAIHRESLTLILILTIIDPRWIASNIHLRIRTECSEHVRLSYRHRVQCDRGFTRVDEFPCYNLICHNLVILLLKNINIYSKS